MKFAHLTDRIAPAARRPSRTRVGCTVEAVEARVLFHADVINPIPDVVVAPNAPTSTIDLNGRFDVGTVVRLVTTNGNLDVQLYDAQKPATVANFLKYVTDGDYNGTIFHRSTDQADAGITVIQGGGYTFPGFGHIPTDPPIVNEFATGGVRLNTRGTLSMARAADPNSATSEFFVNVADNPALDQANNNYAVFGELINNTITNADQIADLPNYNFTAPLTDLPLRNYTQAQYTSGTTITTDNIVQISEASVVPPAPGPEFTLAATSSDPGLVTAAVADNQLTLNYVPDQSGTAEITVSATAADGHVTTDVFQVAVALSVTIGDGAAARAVTFTDGDGTVGTISVRGGSAQVNLSGEDLAETADRRGAAVTGAVTSIASIVLNGTNSASTVAVRARGGDGVLEVGDVTGPGGVRTLNARSLSVNGDVNLGSASRVDLADITGGTLTVGGTTPVAINIAGAADDTNVTSAAPVRSLRAARFGGTDGVAQTLAAPSIGTLNVGSDFAGNLNVAGDVRSVRVGGGATGGTWTVVGNLGATTVGGDLASDVVANTIRSLRAGSVTDAAVRAVSSLGRVTTGNVAGSTFAAAYAGQGLPAAGGGVPEGGTIAGLNVRGTFANSAVVAANVGRLNLGTITQGNNGTAFGVAGTSVAAVGGRDSAGASIRLSRLTEPTQSFDREDFEIRVS